MADRLSILWPQKKNKTNGITISCFFCMAVYGALYDLHVRSTRDYLFLHLRFWKAYQNCLVALYEITTVEKIILVYIFAFLFDVLSISLKVMLYRKNHRLD